MKNIEREYEWKDTTGKCNKEKQGKWNRGKGMKWSRENKDKGS